MTSPKRRRRWPLFVGGIVLGMLLPVGLLLLPPVQAWVLRRVVGLQPGWQVEFSRFAAGATGVESSDLVFRMPGLVARAEPLSIRVAPLALLRNRELQIEEIAARRLRITLTPAELAVDPGSAAPAAAAPAGSPAPAAAPFEGLLPLLRAPLPWAVLRTALDGRVAVHEEGRDVATGEFRVTGGGLAGATPGEFQYEFEADSLLLDPGPDNKLRSRGVLRVEQDGRHGIARLVLEGDLTLPRYGGAVLPAGTIRLELTPRAGGEHYAATLTLGAARFDLTAELDAARAALAGRLDFQGSHELIAGLPGGPWPALAAAGRVQFSADLATGDATADLDTTLTVREWQKYEPELSAVDALAGGFKGRIERRGGRLALTQAELALRGENSAARVDVALLEPLPLPDWPERPLARVTATGWPIEWANPYLEGTDILVGGATIDAGWLLHLDPALTLARLEPARPVEVAGITVGGTALPPMPALTVTTSPRLAMEIESGDVAAELPDFVLSTAGGDRLAGTMRFVVPADETVVMTGELAGPVPTLLAGPDRPLPFELALAGDATLSADGNTLDARRFTLRLRDTRAAAPAVRVDLLQPVRASLISPEVGAAAPELARLAFDRLALDWVARWLPEGWQVGGEFVAGASVVQRDPDGAFRLVTESPWRLRDFTLGLGGREVFRGAAAFVPAGRTDLREAAVEIGGIDATDARGNRLSGRLAGTVGLATDALGGEVALVAELPDLPGSRDAFGALRAELTLSARRYQRNLFIAESFGLGVQHAGGELLAVDTAQPFIAGFNDAGVFAVATIEPLRVRTGEIPLGWFQPWLGDQVVAGVMAPAEFLLAAGIQQHRLRPLKPVHLRNFSFSQGGQALLRDVDLRIHPGADLQFLLHLLPTFQLGYRLNLHGTDGAVEVAGERALAVDFALQTMGNDRLLLPRSIDATVRADLGAFARLPAYAGARLPARGSLVARVNGDLLGDDPLEIWTRLEGIPRAGGAPGSLPPVELTATGKVNTREGAGSAVFDFDLRVLDEPRPSDLRFSARLEPTRGTLEFDSTLRSEHLDAAALLAYEEAFLPAAPAGTAAAGVPAAARPDADAPPSRPSGAAFWSVLRGTFALDLAAVEFAPYRIERVRGRLEATEDELTLRDLGGEMFAGRWGGELTLRHDPAATDFGHALAADFRIEQFETARVVQTVFPQETASVEARIDLRASFASRGNSLQELADRAAGGFTLEGRDGLVRLTLPHQEMASSLVILGGALTLSPELRALGRLLRKFSEMPVERLRISGERDTTGEVRLSELLFDSPQARLRGRGRVAATPAPLMDRPLEASLELAARDEMAVILGRMGLLERRRDDAGYQAMREAFTLGGKAGEPDTRPLYDLLARAVAGSKGTWGFLMRKVQREVEKQRPAPPRTASAR